MKKLLSICTAITASCLIAGSAMAFNVVNAFHANVVNGSNCPGLGAKDVHRYSPNTKWCAAYIGQAVLECNAGCTGPFKPASCVAQSLHNNIVANNSRRTIICQLEAGQQPVTVQQCEDEWNDYTNHCA